jgi:hypothetical protein
MSQVDGLGENISDASPLETRCPQVLVGNHRQHFLQCARSAGQVFIQSSQNEIGCPLGVVPGIAKKHEKYFLRIRNEHKFLLFGTWLSF